MKPEEFDAILRLKKDCFDRSKSRRDMEWKMSIAIWTALGVLLGLLVKGEFQIETESLKNMVGQILVAIGLIISFLHFLWMKGAGKRTMNDHKFSIHHYRLFFKKALIRHIFTSYMITAKNIPKIIDRSKMN